MATLVAQYFLNHRLDLDEIEWQTQALADAGYDGVYAHAREGLLTPYMSEGWWEAVSRMLAVCRRTGMEFWIWDEDYFPSGLAGGRIVWEDPGLIARGLEFTTATVEGPGPFEVDFAAGMLLRCFAIEQLPDDSYTPPLDVTAFCGTRRQEWIQPEIYHGAYSPQVNPVGHPHWRCDMLTNRFALSWTPPHEGRWVIVAAMIQSTGGVHPDILRPESVRRFLELTHEQYRARFPEELGKLIRGAFTDEPSPGHLTWPWTARFPEEFRADHGYDLLELLPHLALDLSDRSPVVRHHYRLTQHRLMRTHYVEQIAGWCEAHGLQMTGHLTRTEWLSLVSAWWPNELRCYQSMHIPTCDPLGAAYPSPEAAAYHSGMKVASSAAHLFGRRQCSSDTPAVLGDEVGLRDLKFLFDYQMVLGINHFSLHGLSGSLDGPRKDEVPPSIFYQHTEWKWMRTLLEQVKSTCEQLTDGAHLCELAVLYPSTSLACQVKTTADSYDLADEPLIHGLVERLLSHQRDFDFIDEVTLQESVDESGALHTAEPYRVILLPYLRFLDSATADALLRFAQGGGRVLAVGHMPRLLTRDPQAPLRSCEDPLLEFHEDLDEATLSSLPGPEVTGDGARDIFLCRRECAGERRTFVFNRAPVPFSGLVEGHPLRLEGRGSALLTLGGGQPLRLFPQPLDFGSADLLSELNSGWELTFEPNHVPLNFWHITRSSELPKINSLVSCPGFDLLQRQPDPAGAGENPVVYGCRFMLTGELPDARLVMDDAAISGDWQLRVNGVLIEDWRRAVVFDCRNQEADVAHALRSGSTPTLNVVTVQTSGPDRGLREFPYLYGSFAAEYRHAHRSLPFLTGRPEPLHPESLLPWSALGCPTFSGSATYRRTLHIPVAGEYLLDLGRVEDLAAISVDGGPPTVLAWPPYYCTLGNLTAGEHELTVEVINGPGNRNRAAGLVSGLLGPVRLYHQES